MIVGAGQVGWTRTNRADARRRVDANPAPGQNGLAALLLLSDATLLARPEIAPILLLGDGGRPALSSRDGEWQVRDVRAADVRRATNRAIAGNAGGGAGWP
jgi:hypothetical protein